MRRKKDEGSESGHGTLRYIPENYFQPLPIAEIFPRAAPLEVDVGCGDGTFLAAMAALHPERNFLGIERLMGRLNASARKARRVGAANVRLLRVESSYAVQFLLPAASVTRFYVLFADPWPKRRHWPRRLLQPAFLDAAAQALCEGGELCIKTDDLDYFTFIRRVALECKRFSTGPWKNADSLPRTDFEEHFSLHGKSIHSLCLTKC